MGDEKFLNLASHDIRSLLTSTHAYLQLLQKHISKLEDEQMKKYVMKLDEQMNKTTNMITDVLDIVRIQANIIKTTREEITREEIAGIVTETIGILHGNIKEEKNKSDSSIKLYASKKVLRQLLENIVAYVSKQLPDDKNVTVQFTIESHALQVVIDVVKKEDLRNPDRISYQELSSESDVYLSIAALLIQKYNGKINYRAIMGSAISIVFSLPLTPPEL